MKARYARLLHSILTIPFLVSIPTLAEASMLPARTTPIPKTTTGVPHVQIGVKPNPALTNELLRMVRKLPHVEIRATVISLPGARGFWLADSLPLKRPDAIVGGREFAHIHPDGSLHAALDPEVARAAIKAGWAVRHPWAGRRRGWEGFVMIYTPQSAKDLKVVFELVAGSYEFITGVSVTAKP